MMNSDFYKTGDRTKQFWSDDWVSSAILPWTLQSGQESIGYPLPYCHGPYSRDKKVVGILCHTAMDLTVGTRKYWVSSAILPWTLQSGQESIGYPLPYCHGPHSRDKKVLGILCHTAMDLTVGTRKYWVSSAILPWTSQSGQESIGYPLPYCHGPHSRDKKVLGILCHTAMDLTVGTRKYWVSSAILPWTLQSGQESSGYPLPYCHGPYSRDKKVLGILCHTAMDLTVGTRKYWVSSAILPWTSQSGQESSGYPLPYCHRPYSRDKKVVGILCHTAIDLTVGTRK